MSKPHIVILGAGFGGTYAAKRLAPFVRDGKVDVTIVNKTNYFLFTPLLHEVATGSLSPMSMAEPLREIFRGLSVEVCQCQALSIDLDNRRLHMRADAGDYPKHTLPYDYLIVATGAETNYYGITGAEEFALPLKSLRDAIRIRSEIIDAFEEAILCENPEEKKRYLSFAVIGGGPTGVEVAAELAEFTKSIVARYYRENIPARRISDCKMDDIRISLIDGSNELLMNFSPNLRKAAAKRLGKLGISLHLGNRVSEVSRHGITLTDGSYVPSGMTVWAAGVKPSLPEFAGNVPELVSGRIAVDEYFRMKGNDRVFVLGDVAAYVEPASTISDVQSPKPVPMLAQAAVQEAKIVADNVMASIEQKELRSFEYRSKGSMVSIGQWFAIGEIFSFKLSGRFTWWLWRTVYLFKFASWKKRLRIAFDWTFNCFGNRDVTKVE